MRETQMVKYFEGFRRGKAEIITKKYSPDPIETVRKTISDALALFDNPEYVIKKKGPKGKGTILASPSELWQKRSDGEYQVSVKYARKKLQFDGDDVLICKKIEIKPALQEFLKALDEGYFDEQIKNKSAEFTANLKKGRK